MVVLVSARPEKEHGNLFGVERRVITRAVAIGVERKRELLCRIAGDHRLTVCGDNNRSLCRWRAVLRAGTRGRQSFPAGDLRSRPMNATLQPSRFHDCKLCSSATDHVHIDHRHCVCEGHDRMIHIVVRTEQSFFFSTESHEDECATRWLRREDARQLQHTCDS